MSKNTLLSLLLILGLISGLRAQSDIKSEEDLKKEAARLFEEKQFVDAMPLYAQLLSLYPKDGNYNYRYGSCLIYGDEDKSKSIKYLKFAITQSGVDPLSFFYLGKAYHLNYQFNQAVKYYNRFKSKASSSLQEDYQVERQIEMCKSGNKLLSKLNDLKVLSKQEIALKSFYRLYDTKDLGGKLIAKPDEFKSKYDKKVGESSFIFLPDNAKEVYFSSYGKDGKNGRDLYKAIRLGNGSWSDPVSLGPSINTPYDENYAFLHPDGRTLYFSSSGHNSMGGYDIFKSTFDRSVNNWTAPQNLDFPYSSVDDDLLFVTDNDKVLAYFASNRTSVQDKTTVYRVATEAKAPDLSIIEGKFIAEALPNLKKAKITVVDVESNETVGIFETDKDGKYQVAINKNGGSYKFNIETTEDAPIHTGTVLIPSQEKFQVLGQELRLVGTGDQQQLVIKNIFDGSLLAENQRSGPRVSSVVLLEQASLEVNTTEEEVLASLGSSAADNGATTPSNTASNNAVNSSANNTTSSNAAVDEAAVRQKAATLKSTTQDAYEAADNQANYAYQEGKKTSSEALELFKSADDLEAQLGNFDAARQAEEKAAIEKLREEGRLKALEAAYLTKWAKALENESQEKKLTADAVNTAIGKAEEQLANQNPQGAKEQIDKAEAFVEQADRISSTIEIEKNLLAEKATASQKKKEGADNKITALSGEKEDMDNRIAQLKEQLSTATGPDRVKLQEQLDALNLDRDDLDYQINQSKKLSAEEAAKLANYQKEQSFINSFQQQVAALDETVPPSSEVDKNDLLEQVSYFQDNDLLALAAVEENTDNSTAASPEASLARLKSDAAFEAEQSSIAQISDEQTKNRRLGELNQEWAGVLQAKADIIRKQQENATPTKLVQLNQQLVVIEQQAQEKEAASQRYFDLSSGQSSTAIAANALAYNQTFEADLAAADNLENAALKKSTKREVLDNWIVKLEEDIASRRQNLQADDFSGDRQEENNLIASLEELKVEKQTLLASLDDTSVAANTTLQSNTNSSGSSATTNPATSTSRLELPDDAVVSPTNDEDRFSNLKYENNFGYLDGTAQQKLAQAEQSKGEARAFHEQYEKARQAAYSLPTAEERRNSFNQANQWRKQSEEKQIEAAKSYAEVNTAEYRRNKALIEQANQYDPDASFTSTNLELANLLSDEADLYYTNAFELRNTIDENSRFGQMEVSLQKAYDYEVLALKKQNEALRTLKLVDSEYEQAQSQPAARPAIASTTTSSSSSNVITNPEVLAVTYAGEAKERGDKLTTEVDSLTARVETLTAEANNLEEGEQKELLLAEVENLQSQIDQKQNLASVYYERERQIKNGDVDTELSRGLTKPAAVVSYTIDVDTVDITDSQKRQLLESRAFVNYANAALQRDKLIREAEIEYQNALEARTQLKDLQLLAAETRNRANSTDDEVEKERLIREAVVIDGRVTAKQISIDSINNIVKVKNFLARSKDAEAQRALADVDPSTAAQMQAFISRNAEEVKSQIGDQLALNTSSEEQNIDPTNLPDNGGEDQVADLGNNQDVNTTPPTNTPASTPDNTTNTNRESPTNTTSTPAVNTDRPSNANPSTTANNNTDRAATNNNRTNSTPLRPLPSRSVTNIDMAALTTFPKTLDGEIFVKLEESNVSAYNTANPIPMEPEMPEGIIYKVQVGAFRNPIAQDLFKGFAPLMGERGPNGITRYTAGLFTDFGTANAAKNDIRAAGYADAFVVAFLNGQRISVDQARAANNGDIATNEIRPIPSNNAARRPATANRNTANQGNGQALPPSFNDPALERVSNVPSEQGLYFTVQVGVFSKPVASGTFSGVNNLTAEVLNNGLIRYNSGQFETPPEAVQAKDAIIALGVSDAFVTAYYQGKRISLAEAAQIQLQNR